VVRRDCPEDRRGQLAELTEDGLDVLAGAAPGHVEAVREHLIDRLTPEQLRSLTEIGEAVVAGLSRG
jgi:DNA-binding MarR family transcriptional regulator